MAANLAVRKFFNMNHEELAKILDTRESEIRCEKDGRKKKALEKKLHDEWTNMLSCVLGRTVGRYASDFKNLHVICFV